MAQSLLGRSVLTGDDGVVALVRLQCDLLLRLHLVLLQFVHLAREHSLGLCR